MYQLQVIYNLYRKKKYQYNNIKIHKRQTFHCHAYINWTSLTLCLLCYTVVPCSTSTAGPIHILLACSGMWYSVVDPWI